MVSRRNFVAITIIMAIVLFLFQGLNVAREKLNYYDTNAYAKDKETLADGSGAFGAVDASDQINIEGSRGTIVYIGAEKSDSIGTVVQEWCRYMKYESAVYSSITKYEKAMEKKDTRLPEMVIVNSENIDWTTVKDTVELQKCTEQGIHLVFANLPDVSVIKKNQKFMELLGIKKITADQVTVKGMDLYANLMLGGENIYEAKKQEEKKMQDLELTFPWFKLAGGTKAYMKGIPEDSTLKVQEHPVAIWRKITGNAYVFAVNGDYMEDETGLGILTGMLYETRDYLIYPVVNAQNLIAANFPVLTEETGLSGTCESETDVIQKLQEDQEFMQKKLNTFAFSSFYAGEQTDEEMEKALQQPVLEQIRTVVKAKDTEGDIVRYQNDQVTSQKVISEEEEQFTYRSWMKVKSVESALGYTSVLLDLDAILYPKTEEDRWENIGKEFAANLSTYWKLFSGFDGTTVSECDTRIRTFLNSRYEDDREDNAITLRTTGTDETAYYVLRTHNEDVRKVTGGTAEKLEDSAWLIRAEQSEVRITLGASDQRYYYEKGAKNE